MLAFFARRGAEATERCAQRVLSTTGGALRGLHSWRSANSSIASAETPPATWYSSEEILQAEAATVFYRSWLSVGRADQVASPGDFFTGSSLSLRYVVVRGDDGVLRAFHNVCRHNAAAPAVSCGRAKDFRCPYHGWTYDLQGRLRKATRLAGIEVFSAKENGLRPLRVEQWGHLVLINAAGGPATSPSLPGQPADSTTSFESSVADAEAAGALTGFRHPLRFVERREYDIKCNWKAFCNNYLDGGYHVPIAHGELASGVDMSSYRTDLYSQCSVQSVAVTASDRLGASAPAPAAATAAAAAGPTTEAQTTCASGVAGAGNAGADSPDASAGGISTGGLGGGAGGAKGPADAPRAQYAFIWPNIMLNRYGPWLDTNVVYPTGPTTCRVVFDYFIDPAHPRADDASFIEESLAASAVVQQEDIALCEDVQRGLDSLRALGGGLPTGRRAQPLPSRYAPKVEHAAFHFHQQLAAALLLRQEGGAVSEWAPAAAVKGEKEESL